MKLGYKITSSFVVIIVLMGIANIISTYYVLEKRKEYDLGKKVENAKDIAEKIFKAVSDDDGLAITDVLFDEKKIKEEEVEYYIVYDDKDYMLAHTYLSVMPKRLKNLSNEFAQKGYNIEKIEDSEGLSVYDISVPVIEGIRQVGTLHVGVKNEYLVGLQDKLIRVSIIFTLGLGLFAILVALVLTYLIVNPVKKLTEAVNKITNGEFDVALPDMKANDEIGELNASVEMLVTSFNMLRNKDK